MRIKTSIAVILLGLGAGWAQSCPQLGLNTVEAAENQFFANHKVEAARLLEKAYSQCRNSGPVMRRIAQAYKLIGDDGEADHYAKLADDLGAKPILRLTSTEVDHGGPQLPSFIRRKYALVVGVSQFKDFSSLNANLKPGESPYQRVPDLQFAAKDAQDFARALIASDAGRFREERVRTLVNEQVTADHVRRAIAQIEQDVGDEDLVVLYFSSHGSSPDMDPAASSARSGFVIMHDTEYRNSLNTATAYPMYELMTAVNRFRARRVIAFLDTCYSGDTVNARGSRDFPGVRGSKGVMVGLQEAEQLVKQTPQDRARVVITSSGSNEKSWESDSIGNGYFTKFLIEAMSQEKGQWNISQIFRYLNDKVSSAVEREKGGAPQHPQFVSYPDQRLEINIILGAPETEGGGQ